MNRGHFGKQILGDVADGIELGISCLSASIEMSDLRDRSATEDPDAQEAGFLKHAASERAELQRRAESLAGSETGAPLRNSAVVRLRSKLACACAAQALRALEDALPWGHRAALPSDGSQ